MALPAHFFPAGLAEGDIPVPEADDSPRYGPMNLGTQLVYYNVPEIGLWVTIMNK